MIIRYNQKAIVPFLKIRVHNLIKNFEAPFSGWCSTVSMYRATTRTEFTFYHKSPGVPGTHFIDIRRMKG